jgi:GNAT superfamily N-acetyltransferase
MKNITFKHIYKPGQTVLENDLYRHNHNPEMLLQYDSNFIAFKRMPSVEEFVEAEHYLRDFHDKHGQKHVRFYFPEGENVTPELLEYFNSDSDYTIGFLELYAIEPAQFPTVNLHPEIDIQKVTSENLQVLLDFQYGHDCVYGINFADQKQGQHIRNFRAENIQQLLALYQGKPAGVVDIIISENTAEIDGLLVHEDFQKKGIGSTLQKTVMDLFSDKIVILLADGEDTPKEMYQKQNYQYLGLQYEALKVFN